MATKALEHSEREWLGLVGCGLGASRVADWPADEVAADEVAADELAACRVAVTVR